MESLNHLNSEGGPRQDFERFTQLVSTTYVENQTLLADAYEAKRTEYGEDFSNVTLEQLFSVENASRFFDVGDAEKNEWSNRQIHEISRLCRELNELPDGQEKESKAEEIVEYLVNV